MLTLSHHENQTNYIEGGQNGFDQSHSNQILIWNPIDQKAKGTSYRNATKYNRCNNKCRLSKTDPYPPKQGDDSSYK